MRERLVIKPQESPIGGVFDQAMKGYIARPGYESTYKGMEAGKIKQVMDTAALTRQAQIAQQSAMAQILERHMAGGAAVKPWTNPDTGAVVQNTDTNAPMESPAEQAARIQPLIGGSMVGPGVTSDMAKQFVEALAASKAMGGSDEARQSMILGGHSVDQNFAPTAAEGNAIQHRNAWDVPLNEGQVKGSYLQAMEPFLSPRQKLNIVAPGGTNMSLSPTGGLSISSSPNGNALPGEYGALPPGTPIMPKVQDSFLAEQQKNMMKAQQAMDVLRIYETASKSMDPTKFGLSGDVQEHAGHWVNQIQQLAGAAGLPVDQFNKKLTETLSKAGADPGIAQGLISGNMDINKLAGLQAAAKSQIIQVLNGFSDRPPNDHIIKMADEMLPQPFGPGGSQALNQQGIETGKTLTQAFINRAQPSPEPVYATPTQANMAPVPNAPGQSLAEKVVNSVHSASMAAADAGGTTQPMAPMPSAVASSSLPPMAAPTGPIQVKSRADVMGLNEGQQFMAPGSTKILTVPKKVGSPDDLAKVPAGSPYLDMTDGSVKYKPNANAMDPNGAPPAGSVPIPQGSYD